MISGIGIDLVNVDRIHRNILRFGHRLAERVLSDAELEEYFQSCRQAHYLARRFAAKEAFSKALGTGIRGTVTLRGISVSHNPDGQPLLVLDPDINDIISTRGILSCHLSLADEKQHALACVILEK